MKWNSTWDRYIAEREVDDSGLRPSAKPVLIGKTTHRCTVNVESLPQHPKYARPYHGEACPPKPIILTAHHSHCKFIIGVWPESV